MLCTAVTACEDEKHSYVANMGDPAVTPTMVTTNVSTLISDSGYTRYNIEAPVWRMYEDLPDPMWKFPQGLELEQYDNAMRPAANMRCDSATYFSNRRLWRLDGHVVMVNSMRDTFLTPQLYWDQAAQRVYSDSFMHVARASHIIEGYGFTSNQNMTAYTVTNPTAIIPVTRPGTTGTTNTPQQTDSMPPRERGLHVRPPQPASQRASTVSLTPTNPLP